MGDIIFRKEETPEVISIIEALKRCRSTFENVSFDLVTFDGSLSIPFLRNPFYMFHLKFNFSNLIGIVNVYTDDNSL